MESKTPQKNTTKRTSLHAPQLGREIWINAARNILTTKGIDAVKIECLAKALNTQRRNFYYHFKNRDQLLDELLQDWAVNNTRFYEQAIGKSDHNRVAELAFINTLWLEEKTFDPKYDLAIRNWARTSETATNIVRHSDKKRIHVLETIFLDLGYEGENARVRAQIAYFYQIGLLTPGGHESVKTHRARAAIFLEMLLGK